ncbi:MAG: alpha/beta hydrolase [Kofleriaceae bacterium]
MWTAVLTSACGDVTETTDVAYDNRFPDDVLDIYRPPPTSTPRPAVLVIHGGGWTEGIYRASMASHAERLAEAGYVTVNIEYRLTPTAGYPQQVQDCFCALGYMRAHAEELGIDPDRIAGLGYSAGGHLVSMLAVDTDAEVQPDCGTGPVAPLAAVIPGAGPEDMAALPQVGAVIGFLGGTVDAIPDRYHAASPLSHVHAGAPPYLFVHGDDDWFVDFDHQEVPMQAALDAVGTPTHLLRIPGGGHIFNRGVDGSTYELPLTEIDTPEAQAAIIDFLDHTIGPPP